MAELSAGLPLVSIMGSKRVWVKAIHADCERVQMHQFLMRVSGDWWRARKDTVFRRLRIQISGRTGRAGLRCDPCHPGTT